ncbi:MAG TPA: DUF4870 domain-containing protein [Patescibacteria group bacterium]|nr:DUF4870 domain-containing protein [Patescibacteria group bacterium]
MADEPNQSGSGGTGIDPKLAALLCYLLSIVGGIVFYLISKDKFVRFHAMQSIILGATYVVLSIIVIFLPVINWFSWVLPLLFLALSIILMIKSYQGERYKLPLIGDIAEKNS